MVFNTKEKNISKIQITNFLAYRIPYTYIHIKLSSISTSSTSSKYSHLHNYTQSTRCRYNSHCLCFTGRKPSQCKFSVMDHFLNLIYSEPPIKWFQVNYTNQLINPRKCLERGVWTNYHLYLITHALIIFTNGLEWPIRCAWWSVPCLF